MRIVVEAGGFELRTVSADQRRDFAVRRAMPRGFAVVRLDDVLVADDELGVVAIGKLGVEGVGAGFAVGGVGERAFDQDRLRLREIFATALRFDVLIDDFFGVLGAGGYGENRSSYEREGNDGRTSAHA